jgi:hypothetical protein
MSAALVLLLVACAIALVPPAQGESPLYLTVEGRTTVAVREVNPYVAIAIGGPAEVPSGGNYSFIVSVTGDNVRDALVSPSNGVNQDGRFRFNLTAPSQAADMTIRVNVTSKGPSGAISSASYSYYVRSVVPITVTARVVNEGNIALTGVPVYFFADGQLKKTTFIDLPASGSRSLTYNWTEGASQGQHQLRMELDPNGRFVRFESGGTVYEQTIWVGGTNWGDTNAIFIGLFAIMAFAAYLVYKRPGPKRRKR